MVQIYSIKTEIYNSANESCIENCKVCVESSPPLHLPHPHPHPHLVDDPLSLFGNPFLSVAVYEDKRELCTMELNQESAARFRSAVSTFYGRNKEKQHFFSSSSIF